MNYRPKNSERRALFNRFRTTAQEAVKQQEHEQRTPRQAPRPPHAIDEALFLEQCNGCGDCVDVCPTGIISIQQDKAYLNLNVNDCTQCGKCVESCSTNALNKTESASIDSIPTFTSNCNNFLGIACDACIPNCPHQALSIEEDQRPLLNKSVCDGCGFCRTACYMNAIVMEVHTNL